ncbi:MAG: pirin family protein [Flavobacteriales bacterium]|nr:pirin family protein [Flavobacteriales bacterium]
MAIEHTPKEKQASGAFAGGLILENKPIGFPQDGGQQKPYSNLFYWANAWSDRGGLIPEHPHKVFEILSFVLEGEIQHYDSKFNRWLSLYQGDAQIIRAGNGITHAERLMENSRMFQIWFDPDIRETIQHEASYHDYSADAVHEFDEDGIRYKNYAGQGGPVVMRSEGVVINEVHVPIGNRTLDRDPARIYSYYVLQGVGKIGGIQAREHDFFRVEDERELVIENAGPLRLFEIVTPKKLSYQTYNEIVKY